MTRAHQGVQAAVAIERRVLGDRRGPDCLSLPNPPFSQQNLPPASAMPDIEDGVDEPIGKNNMRETPTALSALLLGRPTTERELVLR